LSIVSRLLAWRGERKMQIKLKRSGGLFPGTDMNLDIDSKNIAAEKAKELGDLVKATGILDEKSEQSGQKSALGENMPDEFIYHLTIKSDHKTSEIETSDTSASPELIKLINHVIDSGN
jgi:hypothetical protein